MASNSDRARMVGSNFDRVRIVVVGDAGESSKSRERDYKRRRRAVRGRRPKPLCRILTNVITIYFT